MERYPIEKSCDHNLHAAQIPQPLVIRFFAQFFSYIFHPLFIPLFFTYYIAFIHTSYFIGINQQQRMMVFVRVALNMIFFPALSVLLLKGVGFIDSIFLKTQKDRVIPYIASNIFFFWMYLVFRNQTEIPGILTSFVFGVFLACSLALIANIYYKISMHAIGVGGLLGVMLVLLFIDHSSSITLPLMLTIFISGIVCTSRMIVSNHTQKDIYMGFFLGLFCQVLARCFILFM